VNKILYSAQCQQQAEALVRATRGN